MRNNIEYSPIVKYLLVWLSLVLIVMNIPKLSTGILILMFISIVLKGLIVKQPINEAFFLRIIVLSLFAATYFFIMAYYGYTDIASSMKYTICIVGMYAIGFAVGKRNKPLWPYGTLWMMLAPVIGSVLFSFLCVYKVLSSGNVLEIAKRAVPSFWTGSELINGPGLGALASLGICLAPVLLLSAREGIGKIKYYSFNLIVLLLVLIGSFANLALQNRGPFAALVISFISALCIVFLFGKKSFYYVLKFAIALSSIILLVWVIIPPDILSQFTIFKRFALRGLETTGRSTAWLLMMKGIFSSFTGGRFVDIHLDYVHNLWLDVVYDTGIVPLTLLLIFHGSHVSRFIKLFKSSLSLTMALSIICLSISFLATFFIEPALDFSPMYFATSCFFLGMLLRISEDIKEELDSSGGTSTCV